MINAILGRYQSKSNIWPDPEKLQPINVIVRTSAATAIRNLIRIALNLEISWILMAQETPENCLKPMIPPLGLTDMLSEGLDSNPNFPMPQKFNQTGIHPARGYAASQTRFAIIKTIKD